MQKIITLFVFILIASIIVYFTKFNNEPNNNLAQSQNSETIGTKQISEVTKFSSHPWINFKVDNFNNKVTVDAVVSSQTEIMQLQQVFKDAFPNKHIKFDILAEYNLQKSRFVEELPLIIATLSEIKRLDINLEQNKLSVKGLARAAKPAEETIAKLQAIFQDELQIIDEIDIAITPEIDVNPAKIDLVQPPTLEKQ